MATITVTRMMTDGKKPEEIDISAVKTVEDINKTDWLKYARRPFDGTVLLTSPVRQDDLDRVCGIALESNYFMWSSMGDLYVARAVSRGGSGKKSVGHRLEYYVTDKLVPWKPD